MLGLAVICTFTLALLCPDTTSATFLNTHCAELNRRESIVTEGAPPQTFKLKLSVKCGKNAKILRAIMKTVAGKESASVTESQQLSNAFTGTQSADEISHGAKPIGQKFRLQYSSEL